MPAELLQRPAASLLAAVVLASAALPARAVAPSREAPPPPVLALEAVEVEPAAPPPATLCRLRVRLRNRSADTISAFAFQVRIDGREVAASSRRLYLIDLEPEAVRTLRLPNFWSSENGRPPSASGELTVEVRLLEARRVRVESTSRPPVRTLEDPVDGLPLVSRVVLPIGGRGR